MERAGHLIRDPEHEYLDLLPNAGRKALTLQTVPAQDRQVKPNELVSRQGLGAPAVLTACGGGMQVDPAQETRASLPIYHATGHRRTTGAAFGLSLASNGNVIVGLKTPYDDGTTHVVLSPMEFIGRLAALVPKPRVNLTRFHGVFSPNSKLRRHAVPTLPEVEPGSNQKPNAYAMTWAQRLKRVFAIEIEKCEKCGGPVRVIASIEDPDVIERILKHLGLDQASQPHNRSPPETLFEHSSNLF